jgi:hypothetical protein
VKISYITFNGPDMTNDALLSGAVAIASGGVPGLPTIWAKTKGTPQEVRGIAAMSQQVVLLTSKHPNIGTVRNLKQGDRIALPAVKVSAQAIVLQMAAAKEWGDAAFDRFDSLTFSMTPPDATAGMLSAGGTFLISKRFHDGIPKLYRAIVKAMQEASQYIAVQPRETCGILCRRREGKDRYRSNGRAVAGSPLQICNDIGIQVQMVEFHV